MKTILAVTSFFTLTAFADWNPSKWGAGKIYYETIDGIKWICHGNYNGSVSLGGAVNNQHRQAIPTSTTGDITIPSVLSGYPVTGICADAFKECSKITGVEIPNGIIYIGSKAFYGCSSLKVANIPGSVAIMESGAFTGTDLENIFIPGSITNLVGCFHGCRSLASVTIGQGVKSIRNSTFANCVSLASVTIPDSVTTIVDYAFKNCVNLKSINIPSGVTLLGGFCGSGLEKVTIPSGVQGLTGAFTSCTNLKSAIIESRDLAYFSGTFDGCCSLTNVTMPYKVAEIGNYTFRDCIKLPCVTLPDSVALIGKYAFYGCANLTGIDLTSNVTNIGEFAFSHCDSLINVTIPNNVKYIGQYAFSESGLRSVAIDTDTECGSTFKNCAKLSDVSISTNVSKIAYEMFYNCNGLTRISIPSSVKNIAGYAFGECNMLTEVVFEGDAPVVGENCFKNVNSDCTVFVSRYSSGWDVDIPGTWKGLRIAYSDSGTIPDIAEDATPSEVASATGEFADAGIAANVTDATEYASYRQWALSVTNNATTVQSVKDSMRTWISYALSSDRLIEKDITSNDVHVVSFGVAGDDAVSTSSGTPQFVFEVAIDDVDIGSSDAVKMETLKSNLKKVLGVEGASTLSPGAFSSDNVEITFDAPVDGRARFTVNPPADAGKSFFMRVKLNK